jgi:hypothetical protein
MFVIVGSSCSGFLGSEMRIFVEHKSTIVPWYRTT